MNKHHEEFDREYDLGLIIWSDHDLIDFVENARRRTRHGNTIRAERLG